MYIEDQYILEQFVKNFIDTKSEIIVLYGTGMHTKFLLDNLEAEKKVRIAGLMDAAKTGQTFYGMPVLSYDDVAALKNVCIVIIARNSVINVIYRRIQDFANENNISVYNINGTELRESIVDNSEKDCFLLDKEELMLRIDDSEVISFDVFDTLLCRCVQRPADVFRVIDLEMDNCGFLFSNERVKAESEVVTDNYNIYDIYDRLQENTGISDDDRDRLLELEIETEKRVLLPRESMCDLLGYAFDQAKVVFLISDMYIPEKLLSDILAYHGIEKYKKLVVSTDYKTSKAEHLFEKVRDEYGLDIKKWLHIGDSIYSDIYAPEKLGIHTYKIYTTTEMLEQSIYSGLLDNELTIEENIVVSKFASIAYNDPFGKWHGNGKLKIESDEKLVELFVAPLTYKFMVWLLQLIEKQNANLVIFPSRDGFLLKRIYDCLKNKGMKLPESIYLYCSRRSAMIAAADNEKLIEESLQVPYTGSFTEMIKKRYGKENFLGNEESELNEEWMHTLLKIATGERDNYRKYLGSCFDGKTCDRAIFVDFVAMGTVQYSLQKILDKEFTGAYFMRRVSDGKGTQTLKCDSMYPVSGDFISASKVYVYYYFLENIFSSYEPSVERFNADGKPVFYEEARSKDSIQCLKECHNSIEKYCENLFSIMPKYNECIAGIELYDKILGYFSSDYSDIYNSRILKSENIDEFMGNRVTEINR